MDAALFFGQEISSFRRAVEDKIFPNLSRSSAIILTLALANRNFNVVKQKASDALRKHEGIAHLNTLSKIPIKTGFDGNELDVDSLITSLVDSIPNYLERAFRRDETPHCALRLNTSGIVTDFFVLSIERTLRDFWHQVLWDEWYIDDNQKEICLTPRNSELAVIWEAGLWRQESILTQTNVLDSVETRERLRSGQRIPPAVPKTITGIGGNSKSNRRFRIGDVSGASKSQRLHQAEINILSNSYLAPFLDESLKSADANLSCRLLQNVWCILRDACEILLRKNPKWELSYDAAASWSLNTDKRDLIRAISECLSEKDTVIAACIDFLSADSNISHLFSRGVWAFPIVPVGDDRLCIAFAPISSGSVIRRVEGWLAKAGFSDEAADVRRGLQFEASFRKTICELIAGNKYLTSTRCVENSVTIGGEQIDFLCKIDRRLIIGEIKCLIQPTEPMERYNYRRKLQKASDQVHRKTLILKQNWEKIARIFDIEPSTLSQFEITEIVIINNCLGTGLRFDNVIVTDDNIMKIFFGSPDYVSGLKFDLIKNQIETRSEMLYKNDAEASKSFEKIANRPVLLKNLIENTQWKRGKFPRSNGEKFQFMHCVLSETFATDDAVRFGEA
ncbi:hypothetical protein [Phreatobacter oligotrophus]|uniref:hypothetical protein n=1 Tax=Phreatobacter oligotrophus TaxID=1122261 RepID=UPI001474079E|nr:hypothetical protein [Phreatobacter oligotrophus]